MKTHWQILVVDDEEVMCESLAAWLREDGYHRGHRGLRPRGAWRRRRARDYAIYFVDLKMPGGMDGIETMMQIRRLHPEASIIIITAYATVDTAITAMKEGAQEYIVKPCNPEEISLLVSRIIKVKNLQRENTILRKKLPRQYQVHDSQQESRGCRTILSLARRDRQPAQHGADPGRERHRQGDGRARHPQLRRSRRQAVRRRLLRRARRDAARVRAVRPREGRVHRRQPAEAAASSKWPTAARSSSTRSATSRPSSRWTCCASCRSAASTASAAPKRCASMRA